MLQRILSICASTFIIVAGCFIIQYIFYPLPILNQSITIPIFLTHYFSFLLISLIGAMFFRNILIFFIFQLAFITAMYFINLYKLIYLLCAVYPSDSELIIPFITILPIAEKLVLLGIAYIIVLLMVYGVSRKLSNYVYGIIIILVVSLGIHYRAAEISAFIDKNWQVSEDDETEKYLNRGPILYLLSEILKKQPDKIYTKEEVQNAISKLLPNLISPSKIKPKTRNIYLIVVESLSDPTLLKTVEFSQYPFDQRFLKLWQKAQNSTSLSPIFGANTSQAEFEILCGYPILEEQIAFYKTTNNNTLCLPQTLQKLGYQTIAMHPFYKGYWNRNYIYPRIGIEKFFDGTYFSSDDKNGLFISDHSFFEQAKKLIAIHEETPKFYYFLTSSSHYPFSLSDNYPPLIQVTNISDNSERKDLIYGYSNSIYYTTTALMNFVDEIKVTDPNAIIVIVGDHPPTLDSDFNQLFFDNYEVPLIIIDGKKGPLNLGKIAHFEIPKIIMGLLKIHHNIYDYKFDLPLVRPLYMQDKIILPTINQTCESTSKNALCQTITEQLQLAKVIYSDSLFGKQHSNMESPM
jgi:phosphoglycerol transferase MdoB-like AlkP superfamily enzyme